MRAGLALLLHSFQRVRMLVLAIIGMLAAIQILFAVAAESLQEQNSFNHLFALVPEFLRQLLGSSLLALLSFRGIVCLGFFHVAVLAVLVGVVISLATEPAGEAEKRFLDLVLSHPLARHWIITRTAVLVAAFVFVAMSVMVVATRIGLYATVSGDTARAVFQVVPQLALNLGALLLCWGGVAAMLATIATRRSVAGGGAALLASACFITDVISLVWKPLKPLARYLPFHYFSTLNLISGSSNVSHDSLILLSIGAAGFAMAYLLFSRRDL